MTIHEVMYSLPDSVLWEFLKWLAFGQGRYTGIRVRPQEFADDAGDRIRALVEQIISSAKQPEDAALGVTLVCSVLRNGDNAAVVAEVARYVAARQIAIYQNAADFEPHHAVEVQEDALRRILSRLGEV